MSNPNSTPPPPPVRSFSLGAVRTAVNVLGVSALILIAACGSPGTTGDRGSRADAAKGSGQAATAVARLEKRAATERGANSDVAKTAKLPPPPGVDAAAVAEIPRDTGGPAFATLDDALAALGTGVPTAEPGPAPAEPDDMDRNKAVRLYVSGRTKLLANDSKGGVADLEAASKLDPGAPEVWRELAEGQLLLGRRSAAMTSFQQAVTVGSTSTRVLTALGHESLRLRRMDQAVQYLLEAWRQKGDRADPACPYIMAADLGEILRDKGYLRAASDLFRRAADLPQPFGAATRFRAELSELYRRQSDLLRDAGDLRCRVADYEGALSAYEEACEYPTLDIGALIARRVYACGKMGRPAGAALVLVHHVEESQGLVEDSDFGLIRYLAGMNDIGPMLAAALREVESGLGADSPPTIRSRLVRARAAASGNSEARVLLREHLARAADDDAAVSELLATYPVDDSEGRAKEVVTLAESHPVQTRRLAFALLDGGRKSAPYLQALEKMSSRSATAGVMRAYILAGNGYPMEAAAVVRQLRAEGAGAGGVLLARVDLAVACGAWAEADAALAQLNQAGTPLLKARALEELQRDAEALAILGPIADQGKGDPAWRAATMLAVELAPAQGQAAKAEAWLKQVLEADPFDEGAHEALIRLYMPGGAVADATKLTAAVRALREQVPSSRTLRYFNAAELVQRQLYREAETTLVALAEDDISNGSVLDDLVTAWERGINAGDKDAATRAQTWLRAQLQQRPESIFLVGGLARILATSGKGEDASAFLAEQIAAQPRPELSRLRESIIRELLKKPDEADALARERLAKQPPGIDTLIERADLAVRAQDFAGAADLLSTGLPRTVGLSREQGARVGVLCARAVTGLGTNPDAARVKGACLLLSAAVERGVRLSPQLHERWLTLLASQDPVDTDAIASALSTIVSQYPSATEQAYVLAAHALVTAHRPELGIQLFEGLATKGTPSVDVISVWVQLVLEFGDQAALERMFAGVERPEVLRELIKSPDDDVKTPTDEAGQRAEFAYGVGVRLNALGRDELAERAYRRALSIKPDHPWACNNLGYQLLEAGRDMSEAEQLLEVAHRELPDEASVTDSLGWLRYKQRVLEDETGPDGAVTREGALTLLARAADTPIGQQNSTLQDHLGDALFAAGRPQEAIKRWTDAQRLAGAEMDSLRRSNRLSSNAEKRLNDEILRTQAKIVAARGGGRPAVAPPFGG